MTDDLSVDYLHGHPRPLGVKSLNQPIRESQDREEGVLASSWNLDLIKFLFVLDSLELGGAERQALLLANHLKQERRADVSLLGLSKGGGCVARQCEAAGIPWREVRCDLQGLVPDRLRSLVQVLLAVRRERPDVILPYTWRPNVACGLLWRLSGARLCVWNQRDEGLGLGNNNWHRAAVRLTPCYVANSAGGKAFLASSYGVPEERVTVIPNGIVSGVPTCDRSGWRKKLGVSENCFVACMVANVHANKDHETLLKAWRLVQGRSPVGSEPPVLCLAGRFHGNEREMRQAAIDLDISEQVRFLGSVDDITGLLSAADLCVHSSRSEGVPNAVLEAMAAGLPVVGTDIPGISEAVPDAGRAFLAPVGDHERLAEQILMLSGDRELRTRLGSANCEEVYRRFDPVESCEAMCRLLSREMNRA